MGVVFSRVNELDVHYLSWREATAFFHGTATVTVVAATAATAVDDNRRCARQKSLTISAAGRLT